MPILQIIFLLRTGTPIYSKKFSERLTNDALISPFISAIMSFAEASFSQSDLSNIMIGNNLITIERGFLEDNENLLGIMVSTGIDDSTAHAILLDLIEKFVITLDESIQTKKISIEQLKGGKIEDLSFMDDIVSEMVSWEQEEAFKNYDLSVSIPQNTIEKIHNLFENNKDIGDVYQFKESSLIEQLLIEYIYYDLENKLKEKFELE